jgi:hypothetical protein
MLAKHRVLLDVIDDQDHPRRAENGDVTGCVTTLVTPRMRGCELVGLMRYCCDGRARTDRAVASWRWRVQPQLLASPVIQPQDALQDASTQHLNLKKTLHRRHFVPAKMPSSLR